MFALRLQRHEIDYVHDPNLQIGKLLPQNIDRSQSLQRWYVTRASHYDVGFRAIVIAGPLPDADAFAAMRHRCIDVHILKRWLFTGDDDVDVITTAQAV